MAKSLTHVKAKSTANIARWPRRKALLHSTTNKLISERAYTIFLHWRPQLVLNMHSIFYEAYRTRRGKSSRAMKLEDFIDRSLSSDKICRVTQKSGAILVGRFSRQKYRNVTICGFKNRPIGCYEMLSCDWSVAFVVVDKIIVNNYWFTHHTENDEKVV